ncbi:MAG: DUF11 domain-containing protein [Actinobacteria bacterium]|nr:DUF11 domain-containing protein [Actinomycetota bacterium]
MYRKLLGGLASTSLIAGLVTAGAVAAGVGTATPALGAGVDVAIGQVQAQMAGHQRKQADTGDNCIRFDPPDGDKTLWVDSTQEAAAGHGYRLSSGCPTNLDKTVPGGQSAVGITPTSLTQVETGTEFLLGTMRHYNNPIYLNGEPAQFTGNLNVKFLNSPFSFPYELWETPNTCSTNVDPQQEDCSDDIVSFTSIPSGEITVEVGGVEYAFSLVSAGFTAPAEDQLGQDYCPATPQGDVKTKFITEEEETTMGCLYGELSQKRKLTLVKKVLWDEQGTGPLQVPGFDFTATSNLTGSPWQADPGTLTPPNTIGGTASYGPKNIRAGVETVTITEGSDPVNWAFQQVECVDGQGAPVPGVSYADQGVTLANVPSATSDAAPITCTFTNSYVPPGIQIVKSADKTEIHAGDKVTYTYKVTNTGISALSDVQVSDDKCAPVKYTSGDDGDEQLQPSEEWIFECSTTLNDTTLNTATASGKDPEGTEVTDTATATVTALKPAIAVAKKASETQVIADSTVVYSYDVTNVGDTPLSDIKVSDNKCSPVTYKSGDDGDAVLQLGEVWKYECSKALSATETNIATATGTDKLGKTVESTATATVTVTPKPTPTPTVSPEVVKRICPIDVTLHKPQAKKVGNRIMTDKITTKKSSCVLLKPVVLCRPLAANTAGETAFCKAKVTKKGRITVKTNGYDAVKVSAVVRSKPKPGFFDRWKPDTWRKSWTLR